MDGHHTDSLAHLVVFTIPWCPLRNFLRSSALSSKGMYILVFNIANPSTILKLPIFALTFLSSAEILSDFSGDSEATVDMESVYIIGKSIVDYLEVEGTVKEERWTQIDSGRDPGSV